ncbi:hypothetical protein LDENG_00013030, partial [Lucifuga dentata]
THTHTVYSNTLAHTPHTDCTDQSRSGSCWSCTQFLRDRTQTIHSFNLLQIILKDHTIHFACLSLISSIFIHVT